MTPEEERELRQMVRGAVEGAMEPFSALLKDLFGPAAREAGEALKDWFVILRAENARKFAERTQDLLSTLGLSRQPVPLDVMLNCIRAGTEQENEFLREKWAWMLANAVTSTPASMMPSFVGTLSQLSPLEAEFLEFAYVEDERRLRKLQARFDDEPSLMYNPRDHRGEYTSVLYFMIAKDIITERRMLRVDPENDALSSHTPLYYSQKELAEHVTDVTLGNLMRLGILQFTTRERKKEGRIEQYKVLLMSSFGFEFVRSCRPPEDKRSILQRWLDENRGASS